MASFRPPPVELDDIPNYILESRALDLPDCLLEKLGSALEVNKQFLIQELGFCSDTSVKDSLIKWCRRPESTIFVLVGTLDRIGRLDWVQTIIATMNDMHTMQLYVMVREEDYIMTYGDHKVAVPRQGNQKFHKITTKCDATLELALVNVLGGDLTHYQIEEPKEFVTWKTEASMLKGKQLTLRKCRTPVPCSKTELYGVQTPVPDTEVKRPHTMPANIPCRYDTNYNTDVPSKTLLIEKLKFGMISPVSSVSDNSAVENYSGMGISEFHHTEHLLSDRPTTKSYLTLSNNEQFTIDEDTHVKVPLGNNMGLMIDECTHLKVPYCPSVMPSEQNVCPAMDVSLTDDTLSHLHGTSQRLLDNVPKFSLLQRSLSEIEPASTCKPSCDMKQNDLNCNSSPQTQQLTQHSLSPNKEENQIDDSGNISDISKHLVCEVNSEKEKEGNHFMDMHEPSSVSMESDPSIEPICNFDESKNSWEVSSLVQAARSAQQVILPMCTPAGEYMPHHFIQQGFTEADGGRYKRNNLPVPCLSPGLSRFKRSRPYMSGPALEEPEKSLQEPVPFSSERLLRDQGHMGPHEPSSLHQEQPHLCSDQYQQPQFSRQQQEPQFDRQLLQPQPQFDRQLPLPQPQFDRQQQHPQLDTQQLQPQLNKPQSQPKPRFERQQQEPQPQFDRQQQHPQLDTQQLQPQLDKPQSQPKPRFERQQQEPQPQFDRHLSQPQPQFDRQPQPQPQFERQRQQPQCNRQQQELQFDRQPQPQLQSGRQQPQPQFDRQQQQPQFDRLQEQHHNYNQHPQGLSERSTDFHREGVSHNKLGSFHQGSDLNMTDNDDCPLMCHTPPPLFDNHLTSNHPQASSIPVVAQVHQSDSNELNSKLLHSQRSTQMQHNHQPPGNFGNTAPVRNHLLDSQRHRQFSDPSVSTHNLAGSGYTDMNPCRPSIPGDRHIQHPPLSGPIPGSETQTDVCAHQEFIHEISSSDSSDSRTVENPLKWMQQRKSLPLPPPQSSDVYDEPSIIEDEKRYNCIDSQTPRSRSLTLPSGIPCPPPRNASLEDQLVRIPGWCPHVNGSSILTFMNNHLGEDGNYVVWRSRRFKQFVISVSHLRDVVHYWIQEDKVDTNRTVYFLYTGGFHSESLLQLVHHYIEQGMKMPVCSPNGGNKGTKRYMDHVRLLRPMNQNHIHTQVKMPRR